MNRRTIRRRCISLYGKQVGNKLADVMLKVGRKDFCVATAWNARQISISMSCNSRGKIFKITEDYKTLIAPDETRISIETAEYIDIAKYLNHSKYREHKRHCQFDSTARRQKRLEEEVDGETEFE